MLMKSWIVALGVVVTLAGCGSSVKLDSVPVEDKSGKSLVPSAADASKSSAPGGSATVAAAPAVSQPVVAPVNVARSVEQPAALPASVSRLVYFDYDSIAIKPEFQALLDTHARFLRADKNKRVGIEGHTDERGGREYNLALGQKRAEAVRNALVLLGVSESQLEAVSFGKEKPAASGSDEAAMAKNRRAEINYR
jgi:peptidoglycan-associated lipoprotein